MWRTRESNINFRHWAMLYRMNITTQSYDPFGSRGFYVVQVSLLMTVGCPR